MSDSAWGDGMADLDRPSDGRKYGYFVDKLHEADKRLATLAAENAALKALVKEMVEWFEAANADIDAEHSKVFGDDGYNYPSGQEYGLRLASIILNKRIKRALITRAKEAVS